MRADYNLIMWHVANVDAQHAADLNTLFFEYAVRRGLYEAIPAGEHGRPPCPEIAAAIAVLRDMPPADFRALDVVIGGYIGFRRHVRAIYQRRELLPIDI